MATLISIIFVLIFTLFFQASTTLGFFPILAAVVGTLLLIITPLIKGLTFLPLQAASVETSSQALRLARRDWPLASYTLVWVAFALFSFFVAAFSAHWLFSIWAVWLGLSLDAIYLYTHKATGFADPIELIHLFVRSSKGNFSEKQQKELCSSIEAIGEIGLKALYQKSLPLTIESVTALEGLAEEYLKESSSPKESVSYTLGFLLHRYQMIFEIAAEDRLEPLARQIVLSTSKLTMAVAQYELSLSGMPLHFLEKFFQLAREHELKEVSFNSSLILFETAKSLLEEPNIREKNIAPLFYGVIEQMETIAKKSFQEDKNTPIALLIEPFRELKLFIEGDLPPFPDSRAIVSDLDRVLVEFQALESVLQSIPNIPGYSESQEVIQKED